MNQLLKLDIPTPHALERLNGWMSGGSTRRVRVGINRGDTMQVTLISTGNDPSQIFATVHPLPGTLDIPLEFLKAGTPITLLLEETVDGQLTPTATMPATVAERRFEAAQAGQRQLSYMPLGARDEQWTINRKMSKREYDFLLLGITPASPADQWFVHYKDNELHFHAATTGVEMFRTRIGRVNVGVFALTTRKSGAPEAAGFQFSQPDRAITEHLKRVPVIFGTGGVQP